MIISTSARAKTQAALANQRVALLGAEDFGLDEIDLSTLDKLQTEWGLMGHDPYYAAGGQRTRCFSTFSYYPDSGRLDRRAHKAYFQSVEKNSYAGGINRNFSQVSDATLNNPVFQALVRSDFEWFDIPAKWKEATWTCHVHMIRISVFGSDSADITPEGIHSDGYPFACLHLITRHQAAGTESFVYDRAGSVILQGTLSLPLDTVVFYDRDLLHYTSPMVAVGARAHRDVLAVSFSLSDSPYEMSP